MRINKGYLQIKRLFGGVASSRALFASPYRLFAFAGGFKKREKEKGKKAGRKKLQRTIQ